MALNLKGGIKPDFSVSDMYPYSQSPSIALNFLCELNWYVFINQNTKIL